MTTSSRPGHSSMPASFARLSNAGIMRSTDLATACLATATCSGSAGFLVETSRFLRSSCRTSRPRPVPTAYRSAASCAPAGVSSLARADNWRTSKAWRGTCREMTLLLGDDVTAGRTALFQFR